VTKMLGKRGVLSAVFDGEKRRAHIRRQKRKKYVLHMSVRFAPPRRTGASNMCGVTKETSSSCPTGIPGRTRQSYRQVHCDEARNSYVLYLARRDNTNLFFTVKALRCELPETPKSGQMCLARKMEECAFEFGTKGRGGY